MAINCYPLIFKLRVVSCYYLKQMIVKKLITFFKISKSSLYGWIKLYNNNNLCKKKSYHKTSKYDENIINYIITYVVKKVDFDYIKLIKLIKSKFNMDCCKSSIYTILKKIT